MPDEDGEKPAGAPSAPAPSTESEAKGATEAPRDETAGIEAPSSDAPSASASGGETPSAPKKKKKKKKKRPAEANEAAAEAKPVGPVLNAEGWERPGFVLDFPKDPALERLVRAFELGNYALVREEGKKLAEGASDGEVRRAAGELLRRIEPDPLVRILFLMSVALLLFMVFYAYRSHGH